jgi:DNA-binding NarL/FixJ family response regulator
MSGDEPPLLHPLPVDWPSSGVPSDSARAVHAIGVRAQAPIGNGDSPPRAEPGRHAPLPDPLTERESVVLQLLRGSLSPREIAAELGRSPNTIKTQTQAIYRKLGVSTRRAAITRGLDTGILPPRGRQPHEVTSG